MSEKIGKTIEEIDANLIFECRQIVKNIVSFGISEQQKIKIIELISLELESRDAMQLILESVKTIKKMDDNVKFSLTINDSDYNKNKLLNV
jgi:hypothetical protein